MKLDRKPIFDAAKARGATFTTRAEVDVLDGGIDASLATLELVDEARLAETLRHLWGPLSQDQWDAVKAALAGAPEPEPTPTGLSQIGLTDADFAQASAKLACSVPQIRAVDEVESGGGWFEDVRADILDLDGPGGFLDGPNLPKILFEAHIFAKQTGGRFNSSHPNLSSPKWNRALYVGGQGEWKRLHAAMQLDRHAALMSASVGRYQIMGFNHKAAGFATVEAYWDAMMTSERAHLDAFVSYILASGLSDELRAISGKPADCLPFATKYNGPASAKNNYAPKIAAAFLKWSRA
jgi:hypothetical protein